MITPDTMSIKARLVRLEVYLNSDFYSEDSYFALDDKDVQLELEITDAVYDLLGCSGNQEIDVKLKVITDDHISVRSCSPGEMHVQLETDQNDHISVREVKDLQLKMNGNSISELVCEDLSDAVPAGASVEEALDAEENRSTELTTGWMTKKISAVLQGFGAVFQRKMPKPVGEPEVDLIDPEESYVPDPRAPKPESETDLVYSEQSCITETDLVSLPEPKLDPVVPEESCISPKEIATDRDALQEMCITHILNAAAPKKQLKYFLGRFNDEDIQGSVNTGSRYYRGLHINYYGLPTADRRCSDIRKYFMPAAQFIDKALDKRASKVLICCKQGVEHSVTLFLAYLMICHDMMVEEAIDHVIKSRRIWLSRDVLKKLMLLNADLVQQRQLKLRDMKTGRKRNK